MPPNFTNLSSFTKTLKTLLATNIGVGVEITDQAPDKVDAPTTSIISVYLYHAREDASHRNHPPPGGAGPVARTPLSLSLYYVVTAHFLDGESKPDQLVEQDLMGWALKTLHDYPVITPTTKIGLTEIMEEDLRNSDHVLQIIYRPVPPEEAVTFWNGDDQRLIRLSAFYEVRVAMLNAEPTPALPGYVLSVGNYVLPSGVMHIASTHSVVRFTPPGASEVILPASPARVAIRSEAPLTGPPHNQLVLRGARLAGGQLALRSPLFETPGNLIVVDPALNPAWDVKVTATQVTARVQSQVTIVGPEPLQTVLPGTYGASVQLTTNYPLPGNQTKTLVSRSNESPVTFTPFITDITGPTGPAPALVELMTAPDTDLTDSELATEIEVVVAGQVYDLTTDDPPGAKQFRIADLHKIAIGTPFTAGNPGIYPVRLIVRGAEAPPAWIEVPAP
jgi:hypothetical protein